MVRIFFIGNLPWIFSEIHSLNLWYIRTRRLSGNSTISLDLQHPLFTSSIYTPLIAGLIAKRWSSAMIMPWERTNCVNGFSIPLVITPLKVTCFPGNTATVPGLVHDLPEEKYVPLRLFSISEYIPPRINSVSPATRGPSGYCIVVYGFAWLQAFSFFLMV